MAAGSGRVGPIVSAAFCASLVMACGRGQAAQPGRSAAVAAAPPAIPSGLLDPGEAAAFVLELVNYDRGQHGLSAVETDPIAAEAGQRHVLDMVRHGFTAHWGTDGSVPEQRYTEAGGRDLVQENALCFADGVDREEDGSPRFDGELLEKAHRRFMDEVPPNDGHRRNILKPEHTGLGVAVAKAAGVEQPCLVQEFVDHYGNYAPLPAQVPLGQMITVAGEVWEPATFAAVGIARIDLAQPRSAEDLNRTSVYMQPQPFVTFFPAGFKTPKPVTVRGDEFRIDVPLTDGANVGRYEVSVWALFRGSGNQAVPVSLRTVLVQ